MAEAAAETGAGASEGPFCETCVERGRERAATRHGLFGDLCEDCFSGKPVRTEEEIGAADRRVGPDRRAYMARWRERNRKRIRERDRQWRLKNRDRANKRYREWKRKRKSKG